MRREELADLSAFVVVAEERSFTRAAAKLGTSQSALSLTVRGLEERLGVRLLTRTTRSVAPTEAGERLVRTLGPVRRDRRRAGRPQRASGEARRHHPHHGRRARGRSDPLACPGDAPAALPRYQGGADHRLWPDRHRRGALRRRRSSRRAGGEGHDRRAHRSGLPQGRRWRAFVFRKRTRPKKPQDLTAHDCINLRLPTYGGLYAWEFEKRGRELKVRVEGQLVFNNLALRLNAALAGLGLAYLPEDQVQTHLAEGRLIRVLDDWCAPFSGYHLYYPSRRQSTPAFALLVDALRFRG